MRQSLPLCRSLVASGFELPSCDADGHWQARMTPARLLHATRSISRSHTSIGLLPERTITCRLLLFRRHRAHTCQHRKHRDADSTGPESPTAGPTSVPPDCPTPQQRREARGSRRAAPGPPGTPPKGVVQKPPLLASDYGPDLNDRDYGELRGGRRMANGRVLGWEKGSAWTMARGLARQNRPPSALPALPGPSSRVVQKPPRPFDLIAF